MVQIRSDSPRTGGGERLEPAGGKSTTATSRRRLTLAAAALATALGTTYYRWSDPNAVGTPTKSTMRGTNSVKNSSLLSRNNNQNENEMDQCRFYLAESAIPRSGLGLFTAIELHKGDTAQSMSDICIYVADTPESETHFTTHSWARDVFFGMYEGRNPRGACEGFATLFNSMPPGVQTSKLVLLQTHDNAGLRRADEPGAGAISHYTGISSVATRDVKAGSELTIDYTDWPYNKRQKYVAPDRSVPWLREHGMCIDNIRIATATDPSMGRGAFAARHLSHGSIVSPAPLQFFSDRQAFAQVSRGPETLFINYCLSIGNTNMMLYPYGPGVNLINHASANTKNKPNVEWRWSTHSMHHHTWLDLPMSQLQQMDYPGGLILDVVALRDLQPGEELFMDYGLAWEEAWEEHVASWMPDPSASSYVYTQDMDMTQPFRTVEEQQEKPYASNMATVCWTPNWERDENTRMKWTKPTFDWPEGMLYCNIQKRSVVPSTSDNITGPIQYEYEVSLNFEMMKPNRNDKLLYIDTNVPHNAIWFVDKPYKSDMHLPNAFRQPIALPPHIVPDPWLTQETGQASSSTKKSKHH